MYARDGEGVGHGMEVHAQMQPPGQPQAFCGLWLGGFEMEVHAQMQPPGQPQTFCGLWLGSFELKSSLFP